VPAPGALVRGGARVPAAGGGRARRAGAATVLNANFLARSGRARVGEGLAAAPLLWLELVVVGVGSGVGLLTYALGRRY